MKSTITIISKPAQTFTKTASFGSRCLLVSTAPAGFMSRCVLISTAKKDL